MANFDDILKDFKKNSALQTITGILFDFKDQAMEDINQFLNSSKNKLKKWTNSPAKGKLSREDCKWLLESQIDLMAINGLKQAGLAKIQIDKLKNALVNVIRDTILNTVL